MARWSSWGVVCAVWLSGATWVEGGASPGQAEAARALAKRLLSDRADQFRFESIPLDNDRDVYELVASDTDIVIRGTSGVAMAAGLNHYLREYCHASVSGFWGDQLALPSPLPRVAETVRVVTPFQYRYCFNYCCFSYSMAWWDWSDWERAIDWMALQGINMPLAVTGQESVWRVLAKEWGLSQAELDAFLVGPAYLPFGWMGCMDGWGGPLSQQWIDAHADLGRRILQRQRELGMTPVLQGFTGHVPAALERVFPDAQFQTLPSWCGFPGTRFVDPRDPLFARIGEQFVREQNRQFGSNHLYAADTFIEMSPPSDEPEFLAAMAKAVYQGMAAADPDAVWVMQGWLFFNNPQFWREPQTKALLTALPRDRMLVLDLHCEQRPVWNLTEAFHGQPWLWCIIHSFGDQVSLHAGLPAIRDNLLDAMTNPQRGDLRGMGYIMEGMSYNPVVYDFMSELMWRPGDRDLQAWIAGYARRRYGAEIPAAENAWRILLDTQLQLAGQTGSVICSRPALGGRGGWSGGSGGSSPRKLADCVAALLACADTLGDRDTYQYDLTHVLRQWLVLVADRYHYELQLAVKRHDRDALQEAGTRFLALMDDLDELLATRPEFLLGRWLEDAKRWAHDETELRNLEWNARNQITLWGPSDSLLHDYACKQWAGLIRGFYRPRWQEFIQAMDRAMAQGEPFDGAAFEKQIQAWEADWTRGTEPYEHAPRGDSVEVARRLWQKYQDVPFAVEVQSLTTGKPVTCSAALPQYPATLANDGLRSDTDRYWATDVNVDPDSWWQVDLEEAVPIGRVEVVFYFGDERSYGFVVQTSVDGEQWDVVADYRETPHPATPEGVVCRFEPRPARYIRVDLTSNSANTGRHLVEVSAFAE